MSFLEFNIQFNIFDFLSFWAAFQVSSASSFLIQSLFSLTVPLSGSSTEVLKKISMSLLLLSRISRINSAQFAFWILSLPLFLWGLPWCLRMSQNGNAGDIGSIPGWGRFPRRGNSNPLQYSCLGNPMDGGAQGVTVHGWQDSNTTQQLNNNSNYFSV